MNTVSLVGRLTRDPEIRYTQGENATAITRFTLAVDRRFKREGDKTADFPSCVAFGKTAEFIEKYFKKGNRIGVVGRLQTGSYQHKDGYMVYTTDVVVEQAEFVESKSSGDQGDSIATNPVESGGGWSPAVDAQIDDELPFN